MTYAEMKGSASLETKSSASVTPMILWELKDDGGLVCIAIPDLDTRNLETLMPILLKQYGEPKCICFMSDAYMKKAPLDNPNQNYKRGQFAEEFKDENKNVTECLIFNFVSLDECSSAMIPYHYDDIQGNIVYDDDIENIEFRPAQSAIVSDALTKAFTTI